MSQSRKFPVEVLASDEVRALLQICSPRAPTGIRNRALIAILYRGGLRLGEALALFPKDLDAAAGTVTVLHGKGDKRRTIGLDPGAFALVERWLDRRRELSLTRRERLFCTLRGKPLKDAYVRQMLPRLAQRVGILGRIHAHGLRHFYAATATRLVAPIVHVQRALGHANLNTTAVYLARIAPEDTHDAMREAFARLDEVKP